MHRLTDFMPKLLREKNYEAVQTILERELVSTEDLHLLSELYCLNNEYEKEALLLMHPLAQSGYCAKRRKWHALPDFDKLVPRKPFHFEQNPEFIPQQETLDNMCFVTAIDHGIYEWSVECLESIKNTKKYKKTPIVVVDLGLTNDQKHHMATRLGVVKFVKPKTDKLPHKLKTDVKFVANHNYLYFDELCSEYKYVMHIEADTWFQNEHGIDQFLCTAEKQGWAYLYHVGMSLDTGNWANILHPSLFVVRQGCPVWQYIKKIYTQELNSKLKQKKHIAYNLSEILMMNLRPQGRFLRGDYNLKPLSFPNGISLIFVGLPVVTSNDPDQILRLAGSGEIATSIHIQSQCEYIRKNTLGRFVYTRSFDHIPTREEWNNHVARSVPTLTYGYDLPDATYNQKINLRFRTWPEYEGDLIYSPSTAELA